MSSKLEAQQNSYGPSQVCNFARNFRTCFGPDSNCFNDEYLEMMASDDKPATQIYDFFFSQIEDSCSVSGVINWDTFRQIKCFFLTVESSFISNFVCKAKKVIYGIVEHEHENRQRGIECIAELARSRCGDETVNMIKAAMNKGSIGV
uniref:DUF19 domain-containing protein n=1 Tax=Rhabditophanes sp. KR3021 TaxID=114890 RepID=A0AC35UEW3_9BILA